MPEGHVTHRLARDLREVFGSEPVQVSSPQGRFAESAALLDGHVFSDAQAWGKNLFLDFATSNPEHLIHIHLGLIGKLRIDPVAPPVGQVRLRVADAAVAADLTGPQTCALITTSDQHAVIERLGPDPLRADADPERGWARLHRSSKPVAALLMDQKITCGVGNIFRAEVLFRHRVRPSTPGKKLKRSTWEAMWADLVDLMARAVDDRRIDTVFDEHTPESMGREPRVDRHGGEVYVYRRAGQPCWVCGNPVRTTLLEGRNLYWCATCQRRS